MSPEKSHRRRGSTVNAERGAIELMAIMEQAKFASGFDQFRPYISQHGQLAHIRDRWTEFLEALYDQTPHRGWSIGKCHYTTDIAQAARTIGSGYFDGTMRATVMLSKYHSWTKITIPHTPPLAIDTAGVLDKPFIDEHSRVRVIPYFGPMENPILHGYPLETARETYANSEELLQRDEDLYEVVLRKNLAEMGEPYEVD